MDLEDFAGFEDSEVYLEGGVAGIGPLNSLMPRFEQDDHLHDQASRSAKRETNSKKVS